MSERSSPIRLARLRWRRPVLRTAGEAPARDRWVYAAACVSGTYAGSMGAPVFAWRPNLQPAGAPGRFIAALGVGVSPDTANRFLHRLDLDPPHLFVAERVR